MKRSRQSWYRSGLLIVGVLVGPYLFSRVMSPGRRLTLYNSPAHAESSRPARPRTDTDRLRVATFNIAHGRGTATGNWSGGSRVERRQRLDEIAELLKQCDADVVVLNEVDFDSSWSFGVNQARYLAKGAGYRYWAELRNLDFRFLVGRWRFGNAVLSRHPIQNARIVPLPDYAWWESALAGKKRSMACTLSVNDNPLFIAAVHLSHRSESLRVQSARQLISLCEPVGLPVILAGDFNSSPPGFPQSELDANGENAISVLDKSGYFLRRPDQAPVTGHMTFHSSDPVCVIDWVLIPEDWQFESYHVVKSELSDHRAIYANLRMPPRERADSPQ